MAKSNTITTALVLKTSQFQKGLDLLSSKLSVVTNTVKTMSRTFQYAFAGSLIVAGANAAKAAIDFDLVQQKLKALAGRDGAEGVARLAATARELGKTSIYTASQVAEMQLSVKKLGIETDTIDKMSKAMLNFATAMDVDVQVAGETVIATMKKFSNSFQEFADDESKAAAITEQFVAATVKSGNTFETLQNSLNYAGAEANAAGFSFAETAAILGKLADAGFRGSRGGVILRKVLQSIGKETNEVREGFTGLIESDLEFNEVMKIVGVRAAGGTLAIGGLGAEIADLTREIETSRGEVDKFAEAVDRSLKGRIAEVISSTEEVALAFLDNFEVPLKAAISGVAESIRALKPEDIRRISESLSTLFSVLKNFLIAAVSAKIIKTLQTIGGAIKFLGSPAVIEGLTAFFAAMKAGMTALVTAGGLALSAITVFLGGVTSFVKKVIRAREEIDAFNDSAEGSRKATINQAEAFKKLEGLPIEEIYRRLKNGAIDAQKAWQEGATAVTPDIILEQFVPQSVFKQVISDAEAFTGQFGATMEQGFQFAINKFKPKVQEAKKVVGEVFESRPADMEFMPSIFGKDIYIELDEAGVLLQKVGEAANKTGENMGQIENKFAEAAEASKYLRYTLAEVNGEFVEVTELTELAAKLWQEGTIVLADELYRAFYAVGSVVGSVFNDLIRGTKSLGDSIKDNLLSALAALASRLIALSAAYGLAAIAKALFEGGTSVGRGAAAITASGFGSFLSSGIGLGNTIRSGSSDFRTTGFVAGSDLVLTTARGISANDRLYG